MSWHNGFRNRQCHILPMRENKRETQKQYNFIFIVITEWVIYYNVTVYYFMLNYFSQLITFS